MRVYVASKSEHGPMWQEFRTAWSEIGVTVTSTWIDESGPGESPDLSDLWVRCINEVKDSDCLISYYVSGEVWKGAFIEIGAALACGIPVYVCGGRPPGSWINDPLVTLASDPDDALVDMFGAFLDREPTP